MNFSYSKGEKYEDRRRKVWNFFYGDRYSALTVGELKELIADLPDELSICLEDEDCEIRRFRLQPYYDKEFCKEEGDEENYAESDNWFVMLD